MKNKTLILVLTGVMFLLIGCSERKSDAPVTQSTISVHGTGFSDNSSSSFHGKYIQSTAYDIQICKNCHGGDFTGGTTGQSCKTCHNKTSGPENCTTCHGSVNAAPPKDLSDNVAISSRAVGAHQLHLSGGLNSAKVSCMECHKVPSTVTASGHLDASLHAEVLFDTASIFYKSGASYNPSTISCANTYCHGNFSGGNNRTMMWNDPTGTSAACGTCHGDATKATVKEKAFPVSGHSAATVTSDCGTCHGMTVNSAMVFIDPSRHVNGKIN